MIRDFGNRIQRFARAGAVVLSLASLLVVTNTGSAQENLPASDGASDTAQQLVGLSLTESQPGFAVAAATAGASAAAAPGEDFDEDPWEGFNEKMFWFNREVMDRFILKPVATGWDFIFPDPVQRGVHNFFDNLAVVRRVVNNSLQLKFVGAGTELARFTINSTIGLVGFFDVAKDAFGIEQKDED